MNDHDPSTGSRSADDAIVRRMRRALDAASVDPRLPEDASIAVLSRIGGRSPRDLSEAITVERLRGATAIAAAVLASLMLFPRADAPIEGSSSAVNTILGVSDPDEGSGLGARANANGDLVAEIFNIDSEVPE